MAPNKEDSNGTNNYPKPIILIHGGADLVPESMFAPKRRGVKKAVQVGYDILKNGGTSLDAVEAAVRAMENDEHFNAGKGSTLNEDGEVVMDASIMNGCNLSAGSVAGVKCISNPISLARMVMERTPHVTLISDGAMKFAKRQGVPLVSNASLTTQFAMKELEETKITGYQNHTTGGTVGAVAIDATGHLAAATSTGGLSYKMAGRVGDTPVIGSGTYADDNVGAVSATGHGESIAKLCVSHDVIKGIEYGKQPSNAIQDILGVMKNRLNRSAGVIALSKHGEIGMEFTSDMMAWAYIKENELHYGIKPGEDFVEIIH